MDTFPLYPEPFVILPTAPHTQTLVLLHGTSQTGPTFASSFMPSYLSTTISNSATLDSNSLQSHRFKEDFPGCKFIFPTGAKRKTTVFGGRETHAWFDITDFRDRTNGEMEMREGLRQSSIFLSNLIKDEIRLLHGYADAQEEAGTSVVVKRQRDKRKVILLGFSQGSAMGTMLLLSGELERLGVMYGFGGFVGLSGWLAFRRQIEDLISNSTSILGVTNSSAITHREITTRYVRKLLKFDPPGKEYKVDPKGLDIPMLLGHGEIDEKVMFEWGRQMRDVLGQLDIDVTFRGYESLAHWWNEDVIMDIGKFLNRIWG